MPLTPNPDLNRKLTPCRRLCATGTQASSVDRAGAERGGVAGAAATAAIPAAPTLLCWQTAAAARSASAYAGAGQREAGTTGCSHMLQARFPPLKAGHVLLLLYASLRGRETERLMVLPVMPTPEFMNAAALRLCRPIDLPPPIIIFASSSFYDTILLLCITEGNHVREACPAPIAGCSSRPPGGGFKYARRRDYVTRRMDFQMRVPGASRE